MSANQQPLSSSLSPQSPSQPSSRRISTKQEYLPRNRFVVNKVSVNSADVKSMTSLQSVLNANEEINFKKIESGIVFIHNDNRIVPVIDGMLQAQHSYIDSNTTTTTIAISSVVDDSIKKVEEEVTVCAFYPRATHVTVIPSDEERPIDAIRLEALNNALTRFSSTNATELLSDTFAGTPPSRMYRSFVSPRPKAVHILEPIERAAQRTAAQIELSLRQIRADKADYLRNTDKAITSYMNSMNSNGDVITEDSAAGGGDTSNRVLKPVVLVLDNLRSAFNVGSIFRTAETGGVAAIYTTGITCHPPSVKLRKTAFTSIDIVPSKHFEDVMDAIKELKTQGYIIVAMETTSRSECYTNVTYPKKVALIVGNEVTGVDTRVMEAADMIVEIPTFGVKNSLNVASALPIVLFEVLRQWEKLDRKETILF